MDVILLGNYEPDGQASMQRYATLLERLLPEKGCRVEVVRPAPVLGALRRSGHGLGKWLGYIDKFVLFPFALRRCLRRRRAGDPFLVHICDHSNAMYTRWLRDVPHVVTCHDVLAIRSGLGLVPENSTGWTGRILQRWILSGLKHADHIVCVSEQTRHGLLELAPELRDRSETVANPLPFPCFPVPPEEAGRALAGLGLNPSERFVLHVGGNLWYKNREGVIRIFGRLCRDHPQSGPVRLVMAGEPPGEVLRRLVEGEGLADRVSFLGKMDDASLRALYSRATALLFPSLREGFGWPIIEAQACGCPVVTRDRPPMSQIAGPAALLAGDDAGFATQLALLLAELPEARQQRREAALRHSEAFAPSIFIEAMVQVYQKVAKI